MNKKAVSIILTIFEVIVVLAIVGMTFAVARMFAESDSVFRSNTADDFFLMINVVVGTHGDTVIEYPYNLSKYTVTVSSGEISVWRNDDSIK